MKRFLISITLLACMLASCTMTARSELARALDRWQAANIAHYRYNLRVECFCGFMDKMPLSIEVKDGQVVSMSYNDGSPVPDADRQLFARYQTIEALFGFTQESLATADEVKVEYDPTYAFPATVLVNQAKMAADAGLNLFVLNFERLP